MEKLNTKYGDIQGIYSMECYKNGNLRECVVNKINELETNYGILIPQYDDGSDRRKHVNSLSFYDDGNLKSIYLQNQTKFKTSIGILPGELITFYPNGNINRIFPLNGQITAYWSELDEYKLAEDVSLDLSVGKFDKKIICVHFYEDGVVKSITLWSSNTVEINSPIGNVSARIGLSFHKDGSLKSFEPLEPIKIETPIGTITAYDVNALGIHGDFNSVSFFKDGSIKSLITSSDIIELTTKTGEKKTHKPGLKTSVMNDEVKEVVPMSISFYDNKVCFNNNPENEYYIDECTFEVKNMPLLIKSPCSECAGNSSCDGECC